MLLKCIKWAICTAASGEIEQNGVAGSWTADEATEDAQDVACVTGSGQGGRNMGQCLWVISSN